MNTVGGYGSEITVPALGLSGNEYSMAASASKPADSRCLNLNCSLIKQAIIVVKETVSLS